MAKLSNSDILQVEQLEEKVKVEKEEAMKCSMKVNPLRKTIIA